MKKIFTKMLSLVVALVVMTSMLCITSLAADLASTAPVHMVQTFDNTDLSLWEEDTGYTNDQSVVDGALRVTATNGKLYSYFQPVNDWAYVSFDVRFDEKSSSASYASTGIHIGGTTESGDVSPAASIVASGTAGKEELIAYNGSSPTTLVSDIAENEWYNVKVILNLADQMYDVYVNNTAIATNFAFRFTLTDVFRIQISNKKTVNSFDNFYAGPLLSSISEDFESISTLNGSASPVWTTTLIPTAAGSIDGLSASVETDPLDSTNSALNLVDTLEGTYTTTGYGCVEVYADMQPMYGISNVSLDIQFAGTTTGSYNSGLHIQNRYDSTNGSSRTVASLLYTSKGLVLRNGSNVDTTVLSTFDFDKWYNIRFVFDAYRKKLDLYIDGKLVADDFDFRFSTDAVSRIKLTTDAPSGDTSNFIDNISAWQTEYIDENFEEYDSYLWSTKTSTTASDSLKAEAAADPDNAENTVIKLTDKTTGYVEVRSDTVPQEGTCYVNYDVRYDGTAAGSFASGFHIVDYTTGTEYKVASLMYSSTDGFFLNGVNSSGTRASDSTYSLIAASDFKFNTWYNVKFVIDTTTQKLDVYINNECVASNVDFRVADATKVSRILLATNAGSSDLSNNTVNYYDNIYAGPLKSFALYKGKGTALKSAEYVSNGTITVEGYWPEDGNILYVARYNEDGALREVYSEAIGASKWGEVVFENVTYGDTIRCFLWDEISLTPVIGKVEFTKAGIESCVVTYPEYAMKAATFNINDGNATDAAVIGLMNTYGINATFGLDGTETNSSIYNNSNFEIANHTTHIEMYLTESYTDDLGNTVTAPTYDECVTSIETAEAAIASKYSVTPTGLVWPYFAPEERDFFSTLKTYAASNGYEYIRDSQVTGSFDVPTDWQDWDVTGWVQAANTDALLAKADEFAALNPSSVKILSVAGNGEDMTETELTSFYTSLFGKISGSDIWKATNIEICSYLKASEKLVITSESIYNPTDTTLYMLVNGSPWIAEPASYAHEVVAD